MKILPIECMGVLNTYFVRFSTLNKSQVRRQKLKILGASCRCCNGLVEVNWSGCSAWQINETLDWTSNPPGRENFDPCSVPYSHACTTTAISILNTFLPMVYCNLCGSYWTVLASLLQHRHSCPELTKPVPEATLSPSTIPQDDISKASLSLSDRIVHIPSDPIVPTIITVLHNPPGAIPNVLAKRNVAVVSRVSAVIEIS